MNHWKFTDKVADPDLIKGWKANIKWSEREFDYRCTGADRPFRTFDKLIDHAQAADRTEADRKLKMEELIIKQAPQQLR